jgi:3-phenylpropionate/trans-cinnamate dioxygenase ferredoxin subunit
VSEPVEIAGRDELKNGEMKTVNVTGHEILIARVGDEYYAADNRCSHMGADLSKGKLEGTVVTCPRHGSQFDLTDGRVVRWTSWTGFISKVSKMIKTPRPIGTYQVKLEGDRILVEIRPQLRRG